jgi:prepilin-type N-terminal cleavage/methylation domain-containing protein
MVRENQRAKAFTLMEVLVVVLIVGILAAVASAIFRGKLDAAKWSEGRSMMGTIATAIRTYGAEKNSGGSYGNNQPDVQTLGFGDGDLNGTYFSSSNFSWTTSFNSSPAPQLTFTITANAPGAIAIPQVYHLDNDGQWTME